MAHLSKFFVTIGKIFFATILFFLSQEAMAQQEKINTDRPDQSDAVYTLPKNRFQIENGVTFAKETLLNNLMLRYGLTNSTEIRVLADAGKEMFSNGLKPITLSVKQKLIEQQNVIPAITLVGYVSFGKLASNDFQENEIPVDLIVALENEFSDKLTLDYNVGMENNFKDLKLAATLSYEPVEKISTFVEYFATINKMEKEHNVGAGILYALKSNLQLDLAIERSIFSAERRLTGTVGISYLF